MSKLLLLTCLLTGSLRLFAQGSDQKVLLSHFVQDEKSRKMQSIIAVYKYGGQPLHDPLTFCVESKKENPPVYVRLPDMRGVADTSYAYVYFGGIGQRKVLPGYSLIVIGNNKRNFRPALIWTDRNHNLDLSDDGAPDTFYNQSESLDLSFVNPAVRNAVYTVNISRFSFSHNSKYIGMLDQYYQENSRGQTFAGALYSFKEQRINTIAGDYNDGKDSFRIGIKDANCNGVYNEAGNDYLLVGDYGTSLLPDVHIAIEEKAGKTYFERNGKRYEIRQIDAAGAYLMVFKNESAPAKNTLRPGQKLRKFKYYSIDKDKKTVSVRKYRKQMTYVYVWRFDQPGFAEDTAALRQIAGQYSDRVQVLSLNYGETPKELRAFRNRNKINWTIGLSSLLINRKLFIERYPYGLLLGKRLRIKQVKISPSELLSLLQNNQL